MQFEKNKNISILLVPTPIKYLPGGTKFLYSLIAPSIKEGDCSDAWKLVAYVPLCKWEFQIQGIDFDHTYIPMAHDESFRINIAITSMYRLTGTILDVSNALQNTNFPFTKESVSFHHPIIWTGLKNLTPILLSIDMKVHFVFDAWIEDKKQKHPDEDVIWGY